MSEVVTQLVIDASGATEGSAAFDAAMARAKASATDGTTATTTFDAAMQRWTKSLAATDPVMRAMLQQQQALQRQMNINTQAVTLGAASQAEAEAQLERVRVKYGAYVTAAQEAANSQTLLGQGVQSLVGQLEPLIALFTIDRIAAFSEGLFQNAAAINDNAKQAGLGVEAYQAYLAVMRSNGIEADQASTIVTRLTHSLGDAQAQSGASRDALNQLGLSFGDVAAGAEVALPKIAQGLLDIPVASQRARLEVELFGRSGQQLESVLHELVDPTTDLIEKERALGQILGQNVTQSAKEADERLSDLWSRIKNDLTPSIVELTNSWLTYAEVLLSGGTEADLTAKLNAQKAAADAAAQSARIAAQTSQSAFGLDINNSVLATGQHLGAAPGTTQGYSTADSDKLVANDRLQAQLSGLTAENRAREEATIALANSMLSEGSIPALKDASGELVKHVASYAQAYQLVGATAADQVEQYATITYQNELQAKINKTLVDRVDITAKVKLANTDIEDALLKQQAITRDIMTRLTDQVQLAGMSADERERESAVMDAIRETSGKISEQDQDHIRDLVALRQETEQWQQGVSDLQNGFKSFFEDTLEKGKADFGDLWRSIESSFVDMLAQMASQALVNPIIIPMVQSFASELGLGTGTLGAGGGASSLLGSGLSLGGLGGSVSSAIDSAGSWLGFSTAAPTLQIGSVGGVDLGTFTGVSDTSGLFGATSLGGALGASAVGSAASSLIYGGKNDSGLGGTAGSIAGTLLGSLIGMPWLGGLLGGVIGGGIGSLTGSDNQASWADFNNGGTGYGLTLQGSQQNTQSTTQAADAITKAMQSLQTVGVSVSNDIHSISIGADKDYIQYANGQKDKLAGGDPQSVIDAALNHILGSASSTDSNVQQVLASYQGQGGLNSSNLDQFLSDVGFANSVQNIQFGQQQLSQAGQELADINSQFDTAIQKAQALGLDTSQLDDARQAAVQNLIDTFDQSTASALKQITDPAGAGLDALLAAQKTRLQDAQDIGADVAQLSALNDAEIGQYLRGLTQDQLSSLAQENPWITGNSAYTLSKGFDDLGTSIDSLITQANDASQAASQAAQNWGKAHDDLMATANSLLVSDPSLSPLARYTNARTQLNSLSAAGLAGDAGSADQVASFVGTFLQASQGYNASGPAYQADFDYAQNLLSQLGGVSTTQQSLAQQAADSAAQSVVALNNIEGVIKAGTSATVGALADLSAQVAALSKQIQQSGVYQRLAS